MLILLNADHTGTELTGIVRHIESKGFKAHVIPGAQSTAVGVTGNSGPLNPVEFENLPGVHKAVSISKPYKLAGRDFKHDDTVITIPGTKTRIGAGTFVIIAGPCAVESEEQTVRIARAVRDAGAHILRGGAFKPRTNPYSFQGLGEDGLKILATARAETGLPVITEALDGASLELAAKYADIIQIGARNMQNFSLLRRFGQLDKPVMLKRGPSATLDEWLQSAEYIISEGNANVILCERGIRTFLDHTRNTLDLNVVPIVRRLSHLPILVDPSHGTGVRDAVAPMARAAAAVGAGGIMVEVHDRPKEALCDGPQALSPEAFRTLVEELRAIGEALGFKV
ncbi:MAG: 3-deoxy-7-phosphoheptulonate synthase [Elusimicrobiota bacterium]